MVDDQPWWLIEQLPLVAQAYAEVEDARMERERAKADSK